MVVAKEDRCELFFSADDDLTNYYCVEIDSRGRCLDYSASYPGEFDFSWIFPGIKTGASLFDNGYIVEGTIAWSTFKQLDILPRTPGQELRMGLYQAQISTDKPSEDDYQWVSWVDPEVEVAEFHTPQSFGCLELTKIPSSWHGKSE